MSIIRKNSAIDNLMFTKILNEKNKDNIIPAKRTNNKHNVYEKIENSVTIKNKQFIILNLL